MVTGPNQLWVADFAYVATWRGFVDSAFIVDALPGASSDGGSPPHLCTDFVLEALQQAIGERCGRKLPCQADRSQGDCSADDGLGRKVNGGTRPRLSWGRSAL